jgi:hypothetical protein
LSKRGEFEKAIADCEHVIQMPDSPKHRVNQAKQLIDAAAKRAQKPLSGNGPT